MEGNGRVGEWWANRREKERKAFQSQLAQRVTELPVSQCLLHWEAVCQGGEEHRCWREIYGVQILAQPFSCCVTICKWLDPSGLIFSSYSTEIINSPSQGGVKVQKVATSEALNTVPEPWYAWSWRLLNKITHSFHLMKQWSVDGALTMSNALSQRNRFLVKCN